MAGRFIVTLRDASRVEEIITEKYACPLKEYVVV
jgi:hypothetical protein